MNLYPLAYALSLEALITNVYVEINRFPRIIKHHANKHGVCLLYNTCPITPSLHKTFQQIYLILNSIYFIAYTIFHTVTLIYS